MAQQPISTGIDRRDFARIALGTLGAAALAGRDAGAAQQPWAAPGIKLCVQSPANPSDDQLLFLRQLGAGYVSVGSPPDLRTAEGFLQIKKRYADAGITVWNIGNANVHNMPEVTLNLPGRDQKIEEYKQYLRNLAKAGIRYTHLRAHGQRHLDAADGTTSRRRVGPRLRSDSPRPRKGNWDGKVFAGAALARPQVHQGRDLGELHLLHQAGGARGGGARGTHRHSPGRSAGAGAGRRAALHLRQLRRLRAGAGDRQQSEHRRLSLLRHVARRRQAADGQGRPGGDDPALRR